MSLLYRMNEFTRQMKRVYNQKSTSLCANMNEATVTAVSAVHVRFGELWLLRRETRDASSLRNAQVLQKQCKWRGKVSEEVRFEEVRLEVRLLKR
jgi:hypothetical protein